MALRGDFNEILKNEEKLGGSQRDRRYMEEFRQCLDDCRLRDMKPYGDLFTWHGNRKGNLIWERIDRFIYNSNFDSLFNFAGIKNLDWLFLDHKPIEIQVDNRISRNSGRRDNQFKFEELWTNYEECKDLITNNGDWKGNIYPFSSLLNDLKRCSSTLSNWGKEVNSHRKNRIVEFKRAYNNIPNVNFDVIHAIEFELNNLLEEEEIYWKQRSRELPKMRGQKL